MLVHRYSTARSGLLNAARSARRTWASSKPIAMIFCTEASNCSPMTRPVSPRGAGTGAGASGGAEVGGGAGWGVAGVGIVLAGADEVMVGADEGTATAVAPPACASAPAPPPPPDKADDSAGSGWGLSFLAATGAGSGCLGFAITFFGGITTRTPVSVKPHSVNVLLSSSTLPRKINRHPAGSSYFCSVPTFCLTERMVSVGSTSNENCFPCSVLNCSFMVDL
mmetsp:Transcript_12591/g.21507  ORF Transcript_12591/g.21507 Transcript_12591/m.21507 type:complete len:223 (+) Transcript_12591:895-1563(+)